MTIPEPSAVPPATPPNVPPGAPAPQGNPNRKLWIILAASAAVLCLIACAALLLLGRGLGNLVQNSMVEDPQEAAEMGAEVAEIELPSGYAPIGGMNIMGMKMAMYGSESRQSMIILMKIPGVSSVNDVDMESMRDQMIRGMGRQMNDVRLIEQYEATIRGKPGQVIIQEGTSSEGILTRMLVAVFEGKIGLSMMMVMSPADEWDQDVADNVLESIR